MRQVSMTPDQFPGRVMLRAFEGGAVYVAEQGGKFYLIQDEGTLADFLNEEDLANLDLVTIFEFDSAAERAAYILNRGWTKNDRPHKEESR